MHNKISGEEDVADNFAGLLNHLSIFTHPLPYSLFVMRSQYN